MSPGNTVNPGLVNVADQGDGLTVVDQPVSVGPSTNPGPLVQAAASVAGKGPDSVDQPVSVGPSTNPGPLVQAAAGVAGKGPDSVDQPVTVGPSQTANLTVQGGAASPQSPNTVNTTENTVINQEYGRGQPTNVYV